MLSAQLMFFIQHYPLLTVPWTFKPIPSGFSVLGWLWGEVSAYVQVYPISSAIYNWSHGFCFHEPLSWGIFFFCFCLGKKSSLSLSAWDLPLSCLSYWGFPFTESLSILWIFQVSAITWLYWVVHKQTLLTSQRPPMFHTEESPLRLHQVPWLHSIGLLHYLSPLCGCSEIWFVSLKIVYYFFLLDVFCSFLCQDGNYTV